MTKETETRIKLADLPEQVVENVRRQTYDYTVPIVVDHTPHGTGTLVQIDNWLGILTAEHVANDPDNPKLSLNWTGYPERFLRTVLGSFAHDLSISTNALRIIMTERTSKEYGPDLAFIVLPPSQFLDEIKVRKSFYNLTLRTDERKNDALQELGFFALCGFPAVKDFEAPAELGFTFTHGVYGYAMLGGPEHYETKDDWDYYELGVSQPSADEFERNFRGVSGGGVWRAFLKRDAKATPGTEQLDRLTLAGVAFYQKDDKSDLPRFYIRAHGPISVYDNFLDTVRELQKRFQ